MQSNHENIVPRKFGASYTVVITINLCLHSASGFGDMSFGSMFNKEGGGGSGGGGGTSGGGYSGGGTSAAGGYE